jgi:hypothetical protein
MSDPAFVEVCRAENAVTAHLLKGELEAAGIRTQIAGQSFAALAGLNPIWWEAPQILVAEHDVAKAVTIIREFEAVRAKRLASG